MDRFFLCFFIYLEDENLGGHMPVTMCQTRILEIEGEAGKSKKRE